MLSKKKKQMIQARQKAQQRAANRPSNKIIGIDLGTTNSAVAVVNGSIPQIIVNPDGSNTTPSVVSFKNGMHIVGINAKRQSLINPNTVLSIKRHMGEKHYSVHVGNHDYTPQQISAMILSYIKNFASQYMGHPVNKAVITVPAYFDDAQRQATKDAGEIAGLDVKRIINEPTAAALAYGIDNTAKQKILVYDLGGGTFDVSILQLGHGVFQVLSTNGNTRLGGDDFDHCIMKWLIDNFQHEHHINLANNAMALQRLKNASEQAKIKLSTKTEAEISLPFIASNQSGPLHIHTILTRTKFNALTHNLIMKTKEPVQQALADAKLTKDDIDTVILNGGSTYIPAVKQAVSQWLGKRPNDSINPDEAVALGAATQGGIITGEIKNMVLLDVTPLSLGIKTVGNIFTPLIHRNTTIPTEHSMSFTTAQDNQPFVKVQILQGERPIASDDKLLGSFELDNLPKEPAGVPQISVTFGINKNGIVNVKAKDMNTGKRQQITIKNANNLPKQTVKRMTQEAKINQMKDTSQEQANMQKTTQQEDAIRMRSAENPDYNQEDTSTGNDLETDNIKAKNASTDAIEKAQKRTQTMRRLQHTRMNNKNHAQNMNQPQQH